MEDVLLSGQQDIVMSPDDSDGEEGGAQTSKAPSRPRSAASARSSSHSRPASASSGSVMKESKQGRSYITGGKSFISTMVLTLVFTSLYLFLKTCNSH